MDLKVSNPAETPFFLTIEINNPGCLWFEETAISGWSTQVPSHLQPPLVLDRKTDLGTATSRDTFSREMREML